MNEQHENEYAQIFEAIAHPARIRLLQAVNVHPHKFNELKTILGMKSSGNITHHLNKLDHFLEAQPDGNYTITIQGKKALFLVEVINQEKRNRLVLLYLILSASLFYAIWLTFAYYLSEKYVWTPLIGFGFAMIFFVILNMLVKKQVQHEDWQFLWNPTHKL